ncbi:alpha/beta hydrolase [Nocardioides panacisoli]|uniref:Alpha/beta hydrolase n=1 Tax=Nocardioides panacisoli TaxID=627624 RepID=A0ABP7IB89_9ACTN
MTDERQADPTPAFTDVRVPRTPRGLVLVLHGGTDRSSQPVDRSSLSWWRGRKLLRDIAPRLGRDGIGVVLLRYRVRGWNARAGSTPAPVADARWALDELARKHALPVAVVGHSMGGRTGVAVADHDSVRGVVALAPWLSDDDSVDPLRGKVLRAAHGTLDPITSARATRRFVERASRRADASFTDMGPVGHYLMKSVRAWNRFTVDGAREVLGL